MDRADTCPEVQYPCSSIIALFESEENQPTGVDHLMQTAHTLVDAIEQQCVGNSFSLFYMSLYGKYSEQL